MKSSLQQIPKTDPAILLRFRDRQYASELMAAAILEFDFFNALAAIAPISFADLCKHLGWQPRPADVLLTLCRASGVITTDADGLTSLTALASEHLLTTSPNDLTPYYRPISDSPIVNDFRSILRTGKPANWQAKSSGADWHQSMREPEFAKHFTELMNCRGITFGQALASSLQTEMSEVMKSSRHLLDVGGGSGIYSCTMVAHHKHLHATVLEQSPVAEIARREIGKHGLTGQVDVVAADMFTDPWPDQNPSGQPVDIILFSNLLHDWDIAEAETLVAKAAATLVPGGMIVIHGAIINAAKNGPLPVAEYSALLMNITQGKCYSVTEYHCMLSKAGLTPGIGRETTGDRGYVVAIND